MADYIVNMGGYNGSEYYNTVDVFKVTKKGVQHISNPSVTLSQARQSLASAACGSYILAMGGIHGITNLNTVDVFHVNSNGVAAVTGHGLTLSRGRCRLAAASCGQYILALGGYDDGNPSYSNAVDVFKVTESGVEHITDHGLTLSQGRQNLVAASCGNYILAMGGSVADSTPVNTIDVFKVTDNGVEKISAGLALSVPRRYFAAASAGNYILAMGGDNFNTLDTIDVFKVTDNGVEQITDHGLALSVARSNLAAAACGNYIVAMGGLGAAAAGKAIDVFKVTENGIEHILDHELTLSPARFSASAATAGSFILAMGGYDSGYLNAIDVFQVFN